MRTIDDSCIGAKPILRNYQLQAIDRLAAVVAAGCKRALLVSPTGSGKTVVAAEITRRADDAGQSVLFLVPRRELVHQTSRKLADLGLDHGIILSGDPRTNPYARVQVGSVDTVRARQDRLKFLDPNLIIVDEAHLAVTKIRENLLSQWPNATRVGLTATPCRKDGRGLRVLFDEMIEVATVAELTEQGHLVSARYFSISEPDLARVSMVAGDYHAGELAQAMQPLIANIVETWLQRAGGRRTAVFAVNVAHSIALCAEFKAHGVAAEHVDGGTPLDDRAQIFSRFVRGETQVLCNVLVASIGFDMPALDCVVLARPTRSLAMYLQMLGRGLRPAPSKTDCLVLDHSGCVHRLGFAADERLWTLDGHADLVTTKALREKAAGKTIECPKCTHMYAGTRTCPACGHYIPPKGKEIRALDGELVEVGQHLTPEHCDQLVFFLELRAYAQGHNFKAGWAAHKFKERFASFPPWQWNDYPAAVVSAETDRWVKSRYIAYRKASAERATV